MQMSVVWGMELQSVDHLLCKLKLLVSAVVGSAPLVNLLKDKDPDRKAENPSWKEFSPTLRESLTASP